MGPHMHDQFGRSFHYCNVRCPHCDYYCFLPLGSCYLDPIIERIRLIDKLLPGHPQKEHETSHASMKTPPWAGDPNTAGNSMSHTSELTEPGYPQLCSSRCRDLGRHAHVDYCRTSKNDGPCSENSVEHMEGLMHPNPDLPKDWISHEAFWARSGTSIRRSKGGSSLHPHSSRFQRYALNVDSIKRLTCGADRSVLAPRTGRMGALRRQMLR